MLNKNKGLELHELSHDTVIIIMHQRTKCRMDENGSRKRNTDRSLPPVGQKKLKFVLREAPEKMMLHVFM